MAMDFTSFINKQQVNAVSSSQTVAQTANRQMRRSNVATAPEKICVIQVGRNASGQTFAYAIEGGYAVGKEVVDTKNMAAEPFPANSTREMLLAGVCQMATEIIKQNTVENRKTNLRLVMYDNMAIKHFAMLSAERNQEDPVARMTEKFNYSDATKETLATYVEAVHKYLEVTGKLLLVETYRSQLYWDIVVPDELRDKIEAGTILKFSGNDCTNVPGIKFAQNWHRGNAQYQVHCDVATRYNEDGSIAVDENGEPITYVRSFAVVRPTIEKDGRRVPKNAKCYFIVEKMAGYAKNHLPETKVLEGDAAENAMADFM